jgi:phytoene/squalene synthetase
MQPLGDLLDAFRQDVVKTRDGEGYFDRRELLAYCRRSANPVGRLLLHLYLVREDSLLAMSDAVCSALQLVNFWQDLGVDIARGRYLRARRRRRSP